MKTGNRTLAVRQRLNPSVGASACLERDVGALQATLPAHGDEFLAPCSNTHPRALIRQARELRSVGFLKLMRAGKHGELKRLNAELAHVFRVGGEAHFIRQDGSRVHFDDLPKEISDRLPPTLFLNGAAGQLDRIYTSAASTQDDQAFVHLDQIVLAEVQVEHECIEAAHGAVSHGLPVAVYGQALEDGRVLVTRGGEYFLAAREQGETHLLVKFKRPQGNFVVTTPDEIEFLQIEPATTRAARYRELLAQMDPATLQKQILEGSIHPELLKRFCQLIDLDAQTNPVHTLMFLETILKQGLRANGQVKEPKDTVIAIAGFGQELGMIKLFLDFGYQVVGIEDFNLAGKDAGVSLSVASVMQEFTDHPNVQNLCVMDFRDSAFPTGQVDVVLFAAILDEALHTVATLTKVGGIVAVTEMGRIDAKRENFKVDSAESFIVNSADQFDLYYEEVYSDSFLGRGALPSDFVNMKGHRAYIIKRRKELPK